VDQGTKLGLRNGRAGGNNDFEKSKGISFSDRDRRWLWLSGRGVS
jgi:hypothetical protein